MPITHVGSRNHASSHAWPLVYSYRLSKAQCRRDIGSNPRSFELYPSVSSCRLKLYPKSHRIWRMFFFSPALLSNSISEILHQLSHASALWLDPLHSVSTLKIFSIRIYVSCVELLEKTTYSPLIKLLGLSMLVVLSAIGSQRQYSKDLPSASISALFKQVQYFIQIAKTDDWLEYVSTSFFLLI